MRAVGVIFLFGLALIHVSLADKPIEEEEGPIELTDGQVLIIGDAFDDDNEIFAEKVHSVIEYSSDVMKNRTKDEGRYYSICNEVGDDILCLDVILTNSTNLRKDLVKPVNYESDDVLKSGYIFDGDETFAEKMNSLLNYTYPVMKKCRSKLCRHYMYCTKVGYDILCVNLMLISGVDENSQNEDSQNEDINGISALDEPYIKTGNIFDNDEVFAKQSKILLNYSRRVMTLGLSKTDQSYVVCYKVKGEIICLTLWLFKGEEEFINHLYNNLDFNIKPFGGDHNILTMMEDNDPEFSGELVIDEFKTSDFESAENSMKNKADYD